MTREVKKVVRRLLAGIAALVGAYAMATAAAGVVDAVLGRKSGPARELASAGVDVIWAATGALRSALASFVASLAEPPTGWGFWVATALAAGCAALAASEGRRRLLALRRRRWVRANVPELADLARLNGEFEGKVLSVGYAHMGKVVDLPSRKAFDEFDPRGHMWQEVKGDLRGFEAICEEVERRHGASEDYLRRGADLLQRALLRDDWPRALFGDEAAYHDFVTETFDEAGLDVARHLRWRLEWRYAPKGGASCSDSWTLDEESMGSLVAGASMAARP